MRRKAITIWLFSICVCIITLIVIGGITRLTLSGLSIVEWAPVTGMIPPLTHDQWLQAFESYKHFPQFQKVFPSLNLEEFKSLFFWEYLHRLLARLIGFMTLLPALYFWKSGHFSETLKKQVAGGLILGGLQGALGWFMVKSGLIDNPSVSHFRLTAHFLMALLILSYFLWLALEQSPSAPFFPVLNPYAVTVFRGVFLGVILPLLVLQLTYGALVAGLKAGFFYNTFPKMYDEWLPQAALSLQPVWHNAFSNPITVQWMHRWLGTLLIVALLSLALFSIFFPLPSSLRKPFGICVTLGLVQLSLGIITLLLHTPIPFASLHQLTGCLFFCSAIIVLHRLKRVSL